MRASAIAASAPISEVLAVDAERDDQLHADDRAEDAENADQQQRRRLEQARMNLRRGRRLVTHAPTPVLVMSPAEQPALSLRRSQATRMPALAGAISCLAGAPCDAVFAPRRIRRDEAERDVARDRLARALGGCAVAGAAGEHEFDDLVGMR